MLRRFLLALALGAAARLAAAGCDDPGVRVTQEKRGHLTYLHAEAANCLEATLTLTADLKNMRATPSLPRTIDLRGTDRVQLGVVQPSGTGAWSFTYRYHWLYGTPGGKHDNTVYQLPFATGAGYRLAQGYRGNFSHQAGTNNEHALDWRMPEGTAVLAARAGTVIAFRQDSTQGGPRETFRNCANYVVVKHRDGTYAEYLHLQAGGVRVKLGEAVQAGQLLGLSGNTGFSTFPHLHFAVFRTVDGRTRETLPVTFHDRHGQPLPLVQGRTY